jgi:hypothetical protein
MTVAIFWGWLGFLFDRRRAHLQEPVIPIKWVRSALYALGLIAAFLFLLVSISAVVRDYRVFAYLPKLLKQASPHLMLLGRELHVIAVLVWSAGFAVYFSKNC